MTKRLLPLALIALFTTPLHAQDAPAAKASDRPAQAESGGADDSNHPQVPLSLGIAGPYLAARQAALDSDFGEAAHYYGEALGKDGTDPYLQDSALVSLISSGQMEAAVKLANRTSTESKATDLANLMRRAEFAKDGKWTELMALGAEILAQPDKAGDQNGEDKLLDGMIEAWALLGAGKASDSIAAFEKLAKIPGAQAMVQYHLALAKAKVGDFEAADKLLSQDAASGHILGIIARAEVLSQLERNKDAIAMLDALPRVGEEPALLALRARLEKGETLPFDSIRTPADGIAQVFMTFASALASSEEPDPLALIQARIAEYLSPNLGEAHLLSAQLLQSVGQFDLAEQEFERLRELGDMRPVAELSRIDALARADRPEDAEKAALALTAAHPELAQGWIALGDLLRQQEKFADAVPAYDKALDLLKDRGNAQWFPLYARGIALERSNQFDKAEADLRAALKIQPDSAPVLNYLGYSLVDRNIKLDEALKLIQRAVELSPNDGYILDSLAWAYYRLGRYQDAVAPMERAVSSMSEDPLVNDHMGDIYWMAGRKREAQIQWQRALSLKPETEAEEKRIKDKLELGLDAVLASEKGKPRDSAAGQ
ncbi:tetratricopeptide repeat protein [Paracoccus aminophilus]|uniref:TPR repeat-containing protein n=1 Tax=Paracoccus aminophilus JCM 7686 TaxID=1367847 RepID=S5YPX7_PARAH|nr:tetratricopeptide repeat protein [Paracoccus aminophilus]AGT07361.1 TPR repeat-containing protein [Paracoccus aminophilus JCM 7686]